MLKIELPQRSTCMSQRQKRHVMKKICHVKRKSIQFLHEKLQYLILIYLLQCPTVDLALSTLQGPKTSAARPGARVPSPQSKYTHSTQGPDSGPWLLNLDELNLNSVSLLALCISQVKTRMKSKLSSSNFYFARPLFVDELSFNSVLLFCCTYSLVK